ncbi:MAG TPA: KH domain-containing protein [Deltaproteobacteria bacterium]|nr:KH domain-containing protein [Deltaproteobacteria bacterium]
MKALLDLIVRSLVDKPDEVKVTEVTGTTVHVLELRVDKDDIGKVIGKHGQTIDAVRTLLNATAAKLRKHVVLELLD